MGRGVSADQPNGDSGLPRRHCGCLPRNDKGLNFDRSTF